MTVPAPVLIMGTSATALLAIGSRNVITPGDEPRTPFAWLREWPEAPVQKNLAAIVQRFQSVKAIGVGPDRERRIHRARYAAIARETSILSAQHLHRFDDQRRLATLLVFVREMEAKLTDAALTMFDKMMGGVFCEADRQRKNNLLDRAELLDSSARALLDMAKAMLSARANGTDPPAAVEQTIGWQQLEEAVEAMDQNLGGTRTDNLAEVIESYPRVHRTATIISRRFHLPFMEVYRFPAQRPRGAAPTLRFRGAEAASSLLLFHSGRPRAATDANSEFCPSLSGAPKLRGV